MTCSVIKMLVNKLEKTDLPAPLGYAVILLLVVLSVVCVNCGYFSLTAWLLLCSVFTFIFTKKSKHYGVHVARINAVVSFFVFSRILSGLLPESESRWYGDCLVTDNGSLAIVEFFSLTVAPLSYYATKYLVNRFILNNSNSNCCPSIYTNGSNIDKSVTVFGELLRTLNRVKLPNNFGISLFVICILGHIFFGFANAYLYSACEEYNYFNGTNYPVECIYSWKIMDVLLFYASVVLGVLSFKVKYEGAIFVRLCTLCVFALLSSMFGYVYNLSKFKLLTVSLALLCSYVLFRFVILNKFIKKSSNNGIYGTC